MLAKSNLALHYGNGSRFKIIIDDYEVILRQHWVQIDPIQIQLERFDSLDGCGTEHIPNLCFQ